MKKRKIVVIGNSVALRIRPPLKRPDNNNYSQMLYDLLNTNSQIEYFVTNMGLGAVTVKNIYSQLDYYIREFPNYYIINLGVVDASTREIPLWFYRLAVKKSLDLFSLFCSALYRNIIIKLRPFLVKLRGKSTWISEKKFEKYFNLILKNLLKETNAQIIVVTINECNKRVESQLPGSLNKHKAYNKIMEKIVKKYDQIIIDTNEIISSEDYPDGVHFSNSGHKIIAEKLFSLITHDNKI